MAATLREELSEVGSTRIEFPGVWTLDRLPDANSVDASRNKYEIMSASMEKIAVIEDDPGIRTVIRLALKGARFGSVCEAERGDDGLELVVRESETLHIAMFYHARRVGNFVLRIAVPYQSVTDAKAYAVRGLLAAIPTCA